ncbi:Mur ligase, partial [Thamnocephalis sphaerospora]
AIEGLNSLQSNAALLARIRASGVNVQELSLPGIRLFLTRLGYSIDELDRLNAIHIAGTKGKGSTCAMCESVLLQLKKDGKPLRVGLSTSPHLIDVRERIRIDGKPLSREQFAHYFFDCRDRLEEGYGVSADKSSSPYPAYSRFLTIMAFHVFLQEKVDVAIVEVGIGGMYDSTNVMERPAVCGITSLGLDHQAMLGKTLPEIARQKAGIAKVGAKDVPLYTSEQPSEAMPAMHKQAALVGVCSTYPSMMHSLVGAHQRINAALALQLCDTWSRRILHEPLVDADNVISAVALHGLAHARWPGRAETLRLQGGANGPEIWRLDGAHTQESMQVCSDWYQKECEAAESEASTGRTTR